MITVTGCSGFLGQQFSALLAHKNIPARLLYRASFQTKPASSASIERISISDFLNTSELTRALNGSDTIVHILGRTNGTHAQLEESNIAITRSLAEAAKIAGIRRFIYISSVAAMMRHGYYGESKFAAEKIIEASGLPYLFLRPAYIYGWHDQNNTQLMIKTIRRYPIVPVLGGDSFKLQPVYVADVCSLIEKSLGHSKLNTAYTVAGPRQVPLAEILSSMAREMKVRRIFLPIPLKPVQTAARYYTQLFPSTRLPIKQILELDKHQAFDISATVNAFDFHPLDFQTGIKEMFKESLCAAS